MAAADACGVCGTGFIAGAGYCVECGAPVGVLLIDPSRDEPVEAAGEGGAATEGAHSRRWLTAGLAVALVVAGLWLLGGGDDGSLEEAVPVPSATVPPSESDGRSGVDDAGGPGVDGGGERSVGGAEMVAVEVEAWSALGGGDGGWIG